MIAPLQRAEVRIERLLAVAAHPSTPREEARTALVGAEKAIENRGLQSQFGPRIALLRFVLAAQEASDAIASVSRASLNLHDAWPK